MSKEGSTRQSLKALDKYKAWHKEGSDFRETMEVKEVGEFSKMQMLVDSLLGEGENVSS
ncbi:hypothetical protein MTR_4g131155 [Medicago truncatula]|uniref:Uncharacterized protein n=1 Tax=Medicago truncatula TaxID=3880 RepID=A0A072V397_MEDTR|nr:hypothetical protein MTR_4g131155 [Medicago truncatula]